MKIVEVEELEGPHPEEGDGEGRKSEDIGDDEPTRKVGGAELELQSGLDQLGGFHK